MIWKCPYNYECSACPHHYIDLSIDKDYCLKTGKEIDVTMT